MEYYQDKDLKSFFRRRAIKILIVFLICMFVMFMAIQVTSAMVLASEAMTARMEHVLGVADDMSDEYMQRFFTERYLQSEEFQQLKAQFDGYTVSSYTGNDSIQWVWTWPWGGSASIKMEETVKSITAQADETESGETPQGTPVWANGTYHLSLVHRGGTWLIDDVRLIASSNEKMETTTPTPVPTPTPAAATPSAQ